jgi:hypothetical protein
VYALSPVVPGTAFEFVGEVQPAPFIVTTLEVSILIEELDADLRTAPRRCG